ncbi:hypothetical protein FHY31_001493 [Xanthomonas euvesicatoria]|uniref:Uncharacterized protein n=1 Tax=Xanthomonas euvesicatoria TaxID=456327 RepID=A0AAW3U2S5_XANEU|nr:hypothetical protein [Xanthomonas euvesicatoria]MBB4869768.1 hypothetical protein [Xanthomonas euvesicatoria]
MHAQPGQAGVVACLQVEQGVDERGLVRGVLRTAIDQVDGAFDHVLDRVL